MHYLDKDMDTDETKHKDAAAILRKEASGVIIEKYWLDKMRFVRFCKRG